ncbi:SGNH hydrolase [Panus rudis PR-1116 ss-1]|nr:SGNH hydrolase [Panus rudis PR-1116 ss-1]
MAANVQDVIMLVGDSLTQGGWEPHGFAQKLAYIYNRKLDVLNRGLSGYNTVWGLPVFDQIFAKQHEQNHVPKVRLLTIWYGANDACLPPSPQHVPLPQFSSNLSTFIHKVTSPSSPQYSSITKIILITPPPVNTYQRGADLASREVPRDLDREFDVTRQYADAVKEVGAKEGVAVLDLWTELYEAAGREERRLSEYLSDGLHLNQAGYQIVYDGLIRTISQHYPELHYDKLQSVFVGWADVNWENPEPSLQKRPAIVE